MFGWQVWLDFILLDTLQSSLLTSIFHTELIVIDVSFLFSRMFINKNTDELVWNFEEAGTITAIIADPVQPSNFLLSTKKHVILHLDSKSLNATILLGQYNNRG